MQWLEACWRNSRNQEQRNERSHFNQLSCDLDQTRIFSYSVLQREGGHQQLSFISDSHILSLPPPPSLPLSFLPHTSPSYLCSNTKNYCSRKLNSFPANFFLYAPASVTHGILFSPVTEGPREKRREYDSPVPISFPFQ